MTIEREDLRRYLRQRQGLGETELLFDGLSREAVLGLARGNVIAAPAPAIDDRARPAAETSLRVLNEEASGCIRCRLHEGRTQVVFGDGDPGADLVVVGEAPGVEEDRTGRPFVGRAGKLLDLLLLSTGFPREQVYICNVLKCRPPDNRDPLVPEIAQCSPYLHRQIEIIAPKVILAVGRFATQTLLGSEEPIGKLRGRIHTYRGVPLIATYHPAFLLRSPQWSRQAWLDLQMIREVLDAA